MEGGHKDTWGVNSKKHLAGGGGCRKGTEETGLGEMGEGRITK